MRLRMPCCLLLSILFAALFGTVTALAAPVDYTGHALVRVEVDSETELNELKTISPDIWTEQIRFGAGVLARIPPLRMRALQTSGLVFEVVDDDLGPEASLHYPEGRAAKGHGAGSIYEEYKTFDQMVDFLTGLVASCPDGLTCEMESVGTSIEGEDIWALSFEGESLEGDGDGGVMDGGPGDGERPAILFQTLQHAREWITGSAALCTADYIVSQYENDEALRELLGRVTIHLVPCVNPDGYQYTWDKDRYWRKNRRDNDDGTFGVDLNRNWGYQWGYDDEGSSPDPKENTYRGTGPFSEPETAAISAFAETKPDTVAFIDIHSYGQLILFPWGFTRWPMSEQDAGIHLILGYELALIIEGTAGTVYNVYSGANLYPANGTALDWFHGDREGLSYTFELPPNYFDEYNDFVLDPERIAQTCEETVPALLHLVEWAADNGDYEANIVEPPPPYPYPEEDTDSEDDTSPPDDSEQDAGAVCEDDGDTDGCGCSAPGRTNRVGLLGLLVEVLHI